MSWYQRLAEREGQQVVTVGLGIASTIFRCWRWSITLFLSGNLTAPTTGCAAPHLIRADGVGPVGWNRSLTALLSRL